MTIIPAGMTERDVAKTIDHSLLRPELDDDFIEDGCRLAAEYDVASVCVRPTDVRRAAAILAGTDVAVGTVIGFPHGSPRTETKVFEARQALADGAAELDMVIQIGALKSGRDAEVLADIAAVVEVAHAAGAIVKVIFENAYLTDDEKVRACHLSEAAGADFVKTSTGFAPSGATHEDFALMRRSVSPHIQVKAAGGVRTLDALLDVMALGVTRVGATATKTILDDFRARQAGAATPIATGGKAVACTNPLGRNRLEAAEMLRRVTAAGVFHAYLENVVFNAETIRMREMIESGAIGRTTTFRAREGHSGPHAGHFWDAELAGGGALLDMASHGAEAARYLFGKDAAVRDVFAWGDTLVHRERTTLEDNAVMLVRFKDGRLAT